MRYATKTSLMLLTRNSSFRAAIVASVALLASASSAIGSSITYTISDINTSPNYTSSNVGQTFSGTGFVGMYNFGAPGEFAHLFGLESTNFSRTAIQVDLSALAGATISSAILSFSILDGQGGTQSITLGSYLEDGQLGYEWAPTFVDSANYNVSNGANALNVTGFVSDFVSNNDLWLGMHLSGSSLYQWTYTDGGRADRAEVRLTVEYNQAVPDAGASLGLVLAGLAAIAAVRRRLI